MMTFALAPIFAFPISFDQSFLVVKQIAPVLIGYLGQCAYFVIRGTSENSIKIREKGLLYIIAIAPFAIFSCVFVAVIVAFIVSNSLKALPGTGMSFERFTDWIAILLGLFTATISVLTAWLFQSGSSKNA
jgi:hypothetical protein